MPREHNGSAVIIRFPSVIDDQLQSFVDVHEQIRDSSSLQRGESIRERRAFAAEQGQHAVIDVGYELRRDIEYPLTDGFGNACINVALSWEHGDAQCSRTVPDFVDTSKQQSAASQLELISGSEDTDLHWMTIDAAAVGAVEICEQDRSLIFLEFGVQATDPFVIQLYSVHFLTTDRDGGLEVAKDPPPFKPFKNAESDHCHTEKLC